VILHIKKGYHPEGDGLIMDYMVIKCSIIGFPVDEFD